MFHLETKVDLEVRVFWGEKLLREGTTKVVEYK